jgi:histidinol phosphatase-like enzyme
MRITLEQRFQRPEPAGGSIADRPLRAGVLLERDGTDIVDHEYVGSVEGVDFILGAIDAIAALSRAEAGAVNLIRKDG